jgi:hypothetical protein
MLFLFDYQYDMFFQVRPVVNSSGKIPDCLVVSGTTFG